MTDSPNLDLVRSIYADWARADFSGTEWADPEIAWVIVDGPSPGEWIGSGAVGDAWRDWRSTWQEYRAEVDSYRELQDGRVLVLVRRSARGKTSGLDLVSKGASVFSIRNGKVTRLVNYWDRDRAFADLGLTPDGDNTVVMED